MVEHLVGGFSVNCVVNRGILLISVITDLIGIFNRHLAKILGDLILLLNQIQEHIWLPLVMLMKPS